MSNPVLGLVGLAVLFGTIFTGFPIAFTLGAIALGVGWIALGPVVFDLAVLQTQSVMQDTVLASVPFFLFMGFLLEQSGLMERLFTLDALPNLQDLGKLMIGETLVEALGCDLQSERGAQATLKDGIAQAETSRDYVSRDLLSHILEDTEEHIDFLETQLELVGKVGEQNYLQSQMDA